MADPIDVFINASKPPKRNPGVADYIGQAAAGVAEIPAFPLDLLALPSTIADLTGWDTLDNPASRYTQRVSRNYSKDVNDFYGVQDPETPGEVLSRLSISSLIPNKALSSIASKSPKLVSALDNFLLPGVAGKYTAGNAATNLMIPFGADQALREFAVEDQNHPQQTVIDSITGETSDVIPAQTQVDLSTLSPIERAMKMEELDEQEAKDAAVFAVESGLVDKSKEEENDWKDWLAYIGGASALVVGGKSIKNKITDLKANEVIETGRPNPQSVPDPEDAISATTAKEAAIANIADPNAALSSQVERATDKDTADIFKKKVDRLTRGRGQAVVGEMMNSGIYGDGIKLVDDNGVPFTVNTIKTAWKQITPEEQKVFNEYVMARDVKATREGLLKATGKELKPSASDLSAKDLDEMIRVIDDYPHLKQLANNYNKATRAPLDYALKSGIIDKETYDSFVSNNPYYMPNIAADPSAKTVGDALRTLGSKVDDYLFGKLMPTEDVKPYLSQVSQFRKRNIDEGTGVQNFLNPIDALDHYTSTVLSYSNRKAMQREFVDNIISSDNDLLKNSIKQIENEAKVDPSQLLEIIRDGKVTKYKVADPMIKAALDFNPVLAQGTIEKVLLDLPRRLKQASTTGKFAPFFAPVAALYDATYLSTSQMANTLKNAESGLTNKILAYGQGSAQAMTTLMTSVLGIPTDLYARMLNEMSERMAASLVSNNGIFAKIDPAKRMEYSTRMRDAYLNSSLYAAKQAGSYNSSLLVDAEKKIVKMSKEYGGVSDVPRMYMAILEAVHNAPKLQALANKRMYHGLKARFSKEQLDELNLVDEAVNIQDMLPDMSKRGLGNVDSIMKEPGSTSEKIGQLIAKQSASSLTRGIIFGAPWGNASIQGLGKFAKDVKNAPVEWATGITTIAGMQAGMIYAYLNASPEHADFYMNGMSPRERYANILLPTDDPTQPIMIPLPPEFMPLMSPVVAFMEQSMLDAGGQPIESQMFGDLLNSVIDTTAPATPPLLNSAAGFAFGQTMSNQGIKPVRRESLTGNEYSRRITNPNRAAEWDMMVNEMLGSVGELALDTIDAGRFGKGEPIDDVLEQLGYSVSKVSNRSTLNLFANRPETLSSRKDVEFYDKINTVQRMNDVYDRNVKNPQAYQGRQLPQITNPKYIAASSYLDEFLTSNAELFELKAATRKNRESLEADLPIKPDSQDKINTLKRTERKLNELLVKQITALEQNMGVDITELDPYKP